MWTLSARNWSSSRSRLATSAQYRKPVAARRSRKAEPAYHAVSRAARDHVGAWERGSVEAWERGSLLMTAPLFALVHHGDELSANVVISVPQSGRVVLG